MVRLATGQQMVTFLKSKGISITKLTKAQLRDGDGGADLGGLTQAQRERVLTDTPLWFYILREAELNGGKLTGVGARIVAETFHRAMEGSEHSIVRDPAFRPMLGPNNTTFRMTDLLFFAFEGKEDAARAARLEARPDVRSGCRADAPRLVRPPGRPRLCRLLRRSEARPQSGGRPRRHHARLAAHRDRDRSAAPPRPEGLARGRDRRPPRQRDERRLVLGRGRHRSREHARGARGRLPAPPVLFPEILRARSGRDQVRLRGGHRGRGGGDERRHRARARGLGGRLSLRIALGPLVARRRDGSACSSHR